MSSHFSHSSFLAGETPIRIVPLFTLKDPLEFLSIQEGALGPFTAGIDMDCPLWLALFLQQRHLCRLLLPPWLTVSNLQHVLKQEQTQGTFCPQIESMSHEDEEQQQQVQHHFHNNNNNNNNNNTHGDDNANRGLPFRYLEIAQALLLNNKITAASLSGNDILGGGGDNSDRNLEAMRILLQDICQVRLDKIRTNLHTISQQAAASYKPPSSSLSSSWNEDEEAGNNTMPLVNVTGIASVEVAYYQPIIQQLFHDHDTLCQTATGTTTTTRSDDAGAAAAADVSTNQENEANTKTGSDGGAGSNLRSRLRRLR